MDAHSKKIAGGKTVNLPRVVQWSLEKLQQPLPRFLQKVAGPCDHAVPVSPC